ncbi:MAG: LLM class F420-dependent oxidoreductase [Chloroflexi bacterium]|nr:LLM class F420-dependent oxidoreductase [Chloroflexota bacterium]
MAKQIKFGIGLSQSGVTWAEYMAASQEAEALGFDSLWNNDHFMMPAEGMEPPYMEAWTALAGQAACTGSIRLGCLVTGNTYRNPALLAKMAVTIDMISNGRLEMGIGAAWHEREHVAYGWGFPSLKERMDRLEEACQVLKLLWTQEKASFAGRYYQLQNAVAEPKPVQKPHPPLMVAGSGEKRTLRIVAKYADKCNIPGSPDAVAQKVDVLKEHCRQVGRDFDEIEVTAGGVCAITDSEAQADRLVQQLAEQFKATEEAIRAGALLGSSQRILEAIGRFIGAGVTHLIFTPLERFDIDGKLGLKGGDQLRRFAREVLPSFR